MTRIRTALLALVLVAVAAVTARAQNNPTINYAALRADILANTAQAGGTNPAYATTPINQLPINDDTNQLVADWYNGTASPTFHVYRSAIPVAELFDAIVWANFTPSDSVPTATSLENDIYQSRQIACQTKQMNLQTMMIGQAAVNGAKANIRAGLQDALTNIPSGANGANRSAGWTTVRDTVLARASTRAEKLFASTASGNGSAPNAAATLVFEGALASGDVSAARAN